MTEELKKEIWSYFQKTQVIYLATIDNVFPRVRPVTLVYLKDRFWVATGTSDAKVAQLKKSNAVEFCLTIKNEQNSGYIRGAGKAIFVTDKEDRKFVFDTLPYLKEFWATPDNPEYTLMEIKLEEIEYLKIGEFLAKKFKI